MVDDKVNVPVPALVKYPPVVMPARVIALLKVKSELLSIRNVALEAIDIADVAAPMLLGSLICNVPPVIAVVPV